VSGACLPLPPPTGSDMHQVLNEYHGEPNKQNDRLGAANGFQKHGDCRGDCDPGGKRPGEPRIRDEQAEKFASNCCQNLHRKGTLDCPGHAYTAGNLANQSQAHESGSREPGHQAENRQIRAGPR